MILYSTWKLVPAMAVGTEIIKKTPFEEDLIFKAIVIYKPMSENVDFKLTLKFQIFQNILWKLEQLIEMGVETALI